MYIILKSTLYLGQYGILLVCELKWFKIAKVQTCIDGWWQPALSSVLIGTGGHEMTTKEAFVKTKQIHKGQNQDNLREGNIWNPDQTSCEVYHLLNVMLHEPRTPVLFKPLYTLPFIGCLYV